MWTSYERGVIIWSIKLSVKEMFCPSIMEIYVSSRGRIKPRYDEFRWIYPWLMKQ